uniref:sulfatase-like hydrolase/transferase n=1 Tax=uncultured Sphingomonas sp. TaxID=158754 RepID=UPI0035C95A04
MKRFPVLSRVRRGLLLTACALAAVIPGVSLAVAGQVAPAPAPAPQPAAAHRPNILFVLIDDMGFADLSIMGDRKIATPNLDRLAQQGVLLTQFYDAAPICSPSRAGFFTGRFPAESGFVTFINDHQANAEFGQVDWLDPRAPNIARKLHDAGYATGHFGKWHMGGGRDVGGAPWPTAYGFDESFTTFEGLGPRVLVSDEERNLADQSAALGQGPFFYEKKTNLTQLYADKTLDFVSRHRGQPWYVQLWLNDVHDPWAPDDNSLHEVQGKGRTIDDDRYLATVVKMDRTLGNLFERLKDMGQADNTLIVVTSDNGPSALQRYYKNGATPPGSVLSLRGRKGSLYEGGIRQPLIVSWPGHMKAGIRDETTIAQGVDLAPTFARAAGVDYGAAGEGIDLSPVFGGATLPRRPLLFWAFGMPGAQRQPRGPFDPHDVAPGLAVRDGKWKLLAQSDGSNVQLYDLSQDPTESVNLAAGQRRVRDRLLARLRAWSATLGKK